MALLLKPDGVFLNGKKIEVKDIFIMDSNGKAFDILEAIKALVKTTDFCEDNSKSPVKEQSIADGTRCVFSFKDMYSECRDFRPGSLIEEEYKNLEGRECEVLGLETYTELGEKEFEYYNLKFDEYPGIVFQGYSGYHLTPIGK